MSECNKNGSCKYLMTENIYFATGMLCRDFFYHRHPLNPQVSGEFVRTEKFACEAFGIIILILFRFPGLVLRNRGGNSSLLVIF